MRVRVSDQELASVASARVPPGPPHPQESVVLAGSDPPVLEGLSPESELEPAAWESHPVSGSAHLVSEPCPTVTTRQCLLDTPRWPMQATPAVMSAAFIIGP